MQAPSNGDDLREQGQRRQFDKVSTAPATCIPMQIANLQVLDGQGRAVAKDNSSAGLRSDCWNSPLCPRNMPSNALTQGNVPLSCGSGDSTASAQQSTNQRGPAITEVSMQGCGNEASSAGNSEQGRPTMKRARTTTSMITDIKVDMSEDASPIFSPTSSTAATATPTSRLASVVSVSKEKRLPHHVIERRYRENLNSQIESLRAAVPSTSACLTLDMEDIGSSNSTSAIRPLSKAAVIAHAAEYMRQLSAQNEEVERVNRELRVTVEALKRLVNCEDCGVVQQIVDAGA